jgi:hypothetical protein
LIHKTTDIFGEIYNLGLHEDAAKTYDLDNLIENSWVIEQLCTTVCAEISGLTFTTDLVDELEEDDLSEIESCCTDEYPCDER